MSLFQLSIAAGIIGSPLTGLIIGMRTGLVGGISGLVIGFAFGFLFLFGLCRILFHVLRIAESKSGATTNTRRTSQSNSRLQNVVSEFNSMIVVLVLLSPLLSIPATAWIVRIALTPS